MPRSVHALRVADGVYLHDGRVADVAVLGLELDLGLLRVGQGLLDARPEPRVLHLALLVDDLCIFVL